MIAPTTNTRTTAANSLNDSDWPITRPLDVGTVLRSPCSLAIATSGMRARTIGCVSCRSIARFPFRQTTARNWGAQQWIESNRFKLRYRFGLHQS